MIELRSVSAGYGGVAVIQDVALRVADGGYVGIIGPSGAGKTTLLRTLLGATPYVRGEVRIAGQLVRPGRPPAGVGYIPQVATVDWTFPVTVADVARMGLSPNGNWLPWPNREQRRRVAAVLERLGLGGLANRQIQELSGGQQRRAFLARALVGRPRLLCLDEPTASLDIATRDAILRLLGELHAEGTTIVITTHELSGAMTQLPW
ncbi:MAG: metal ABC transporter ATP-binding protein, partial [Chloroflexota bacterium]|nr:metal ABC transporter ATP-binding protein [Chloroflexota bacterium]